MKQNFILNIQNNTSGQVPLTILNSFNGIINARTRYAWDITSVAFSPPVFTMEVRANASQSFQTIGGSATDLSSFLTALNNLDIGTFWIETVGPTTYLVTWNDTLIYQNLVIGTAFTFTIDMNITAPGQPLAFTLNGAGTISGQIDYGDGTIVNFSQAGPIAFNHAYAAAGNYTAGIFLNNPSGVTSIFGATTRITGFGSLSNLVNLASLSLINVPILSVDVTGNPNLITLSVQNALLPNAGQLTNVNVTQNPLLTTLFITGHAAITQIDISQNAALTNFRATNNSLNQCDVSNNPLMNDCRVTNNNLPVVVINTLLITLDTAGLLNGTFLSFSQVPSAAPTGAGAVAKTNLQGKGWTVTTD